MPDYRQLWEDKSGEAPKESVIAGLQKLINNKQDEIIEMDAQVQGLKGRIQEYNEILVDMEKEYKQQQQRIKELEAELGGDSSSSYSSTSVQEAEGSGNALKVRQLQAKLNEMQNKLFIYSNLPSRITDLEGKLEEKDEIIDEYADKVEDLRKRMNNLSEDEGAKKVIANMEDKIERQKETIKKIRSGP